MVNDSLTNMSVKIDDIKSLLCGTFCHARPENAQQSRPDSSSTVFSDNATSFMFNTAKRGVDVIGGPHDAHLQSGGGGGSEAYSNPGTSPFLAPCHHSMDTHSRLLLEQHQQQKQRQLQLYRVSGVLFGRRLGRTILLRKNHLTIFCCVRRLRLVSFVLVFRMCV